MLNDSLYVMIAGRQIVSPVEDVEGQEGDGEEDGGDLVDLFG